MEEGTQSEGKKYVDWNRKLCYEMKGSMVDDGGKYTRRRENGCWASEESMVTVE